ncbi:hypothetical protein 3 [Hubei picorna-like virus 73]|uniref:hypothetical protein 3 n=1 Tax=Hubei picorna-like virus 73 TaxID=1923157 RepID=UPI00090C882C|nr:hypothetical protein 3 [Hubei picorna-like virus 73]APG77515.1 hypothetical protein 3 [Hubei picorna-like virus 73]
MAFIFNGALPTVVSTRYELALFRATANNILRGEPETFQEHVRAVLELGNGEISIDGLVNAGLNRKGSQQFVTQWFTFGAFFNQKLNFRFCNLNNSGFATKMIVNFFTEREIKGQSWLWFCEQLGKIIPHDFDKFEKEMICDCLEQLRASYYFDSSTVSQLYSLDTLDSSFLRQFPFFLSQHGLVWRQVLKTVILPQSKIPKGRQAHYAAHWYSCVQKLRDHHPDLILDVGTEIDYLKIRPMFVRLLNTEPTLEDCQLIEFIHRQYDVFKWLYMIPALSGNKIFDLRVLAFAWYLYGRVTLSNLYYDCFLEVQQDVREYSVHSCPFVPAAWEALERLDYLQDEHLFYDLASKILTNIVCHFICAADATQQCVTVYELLHGEPREKFGTLKGLAYCARLRDYFNKVLPGVTDKVFYVDPWC